MTAVSVFEQCVLAIRAGELIRRVSTSDKEFHFQNWFKRRLQQTGARFEAGGRNSYPDFRMVATTEGYEVNGLAYPGREANFDSNSQVPTGFHNGRDIYYVFGRYPQKPDRKSYPVLDLVVCHGDFLNADHEYVHKNKNVKGFGTYGDIMIRDRKMYVVPTPFHLIDGVAHRETLILPSKVDPGREFDSVGDLLRQEAEQLVVGYTFDLASNELVLKKIPNPGAGREHTSRAWRLKGSPVEEVAMRHVRTVDEISDSDDEGGDE